MSIIKKITNINIFAQCRSSRLSLWQCPSFLFIIMGLVNVIAMIGTYALTSTKYGDEPEIAAFIVVLVSLVLFIIGVLIVENFNKVVEANRLKSEFVSIVSHQLRSPISSINWTLDLILGKRLGEVNDKVLDYLKSAKISTKRMIALVNDILNVKHIEEGRFGDNIKSVNIREVVDKVFDDLKSFAAANNVELLLEENVNETSERYNKNSDHFFVIEADPEEIKMIIQNLVENGIKYIKNSGCVKIKLDRIESFAKITVEDNGVGVPEADRKYLFQKFFRASNVRSIQTEGTGLGLFIAKIIVEKLGGKIGFTSKEGEGSVFWVTLPIINH
ncbi:MAG: HAMP domain-containing sensor histidine kinase [Patescibacteria group bacterium]